MAPFIKIDGELALEEYSVLEESLHVAREGCFRTGCDNISGTARPIFINFGMRPDTIHPVMTHP